MRQVAEPVALLLAEAIDAPIGIPVAAPVGIFGGSILGQRIVAPTLGQGVQLSGKSRRSAALPLPQETGETTSRTTIHPASATAHRLLDGVSAIPCSARLPVRLRGQRNCRAPSHEAGWDRRPGPPGRLRVPSLESHSSAARRTCTGGRWRPPASPAGGDDRTLRVDAPMLLAVPQHWPGNPDDAGRPCSDPCRGQARHRPGLPGTRSGFWPASPGTPKHKASDACAMRPVSTGGAVRVTA